jgi:hypothetical protein
MEARYGRPCDPRYGRCPADRNYLEIVITREFDASPELVFEAVSKPEHLRGH